MMSATGIRGTRRCSSGLRLGYLLLAVGVLLPLELEAQEPLDFIIAVDTSGSMVDEVAEVQAGLNDLASSLAASGFDVRLILITDDSVSGGICVPPPLGSGSCPADESLPGYRHVVQAVGSSNALQQILATYASWSGSLRAGSRRSVMVVSDDDSALSAADFVDGLIALDPDFASFQFHAIAASAKGMPVLSDPGPCDCLFNDLTCEIKSSAQGVVYEELTGVRPGVFFDLCTQDFDLAWPLIAGSIDGLIFFDGFRSGDTSLWSSATP